ncbi:MAG: DUF2934 domain-containing protein [Pseudomonadota bacterium]
MTTPMLDDAQIRDAAYFLWLDEGQPEGRDEAHWLKAIDALTPAKPASKPRTAKAPAAKAPAKKAAAKAPAKASAKAGAKTAAKTPRAKAKA